MVYLVEFWLTRTSTAKDIIWSTVGGFALTGVSGVAKHVVEPQHILDYGFPLSWLRRTFAVWPLTPDYRVIWSGLTVDLALFTAVCFLVLRVGNRVGLGNVLTHTFTRIQLLLIANLLAYAIVDVKVPEWLLGTWGVPDIHSYHIWVLKWLYYLTVFLISYSAVRLPEFLGGVATGFMLMEFGSIDLLYFLIQGKQLPNNFTWFYLHRLFGIGKGLVYTPELVVTLSLTSSALVLALNFLFRRIGR